MIELIRKELPRNSRLVAISLVSTGLLSQYKPVAARTSGSLVSRYDLWKDEPDLQLYKGFSVLEAVKQWGWL